MYKILVSWRSIHFGLNKYKTKCFEINKWLFFFSRKIFPNSKNNREMCRARWKSKTEIKTHSSDSHNYIRNISYARKVIFIAYGIFLQAEKLDFF